MRNYLAALLLVTVLTPACARPGAGTAAGSGTGLSVADALTQADGAITALETLAKTVPLDAKTQAQIDGYAAWAKIALQAAGIIAPVVEAAGS